MAQNIALSMSQTQRMDASQMQVLEIVTLPLEELSDKIKKEAEKNPVINISEGERSYEDISSRSYSSSPSYSDEANSSDYSDDGENDWFEKTVTEKESLTEHLMNQLGCIPLTPPVKKAAEIIISSLDPHGFTGPDPSSLLPDSLKEYTKEGEYAAPVVLDLPDECTVLKDVTVDFELIKKD